MARINFFLCLLAIVGCVTMRPVDAITHVVGGSLGWTSPDNATYYQDWANARTFNAGDKLIFPFRSDVQNVIEVSKEDFQVCGEKNVVQMYATGPLILELTAGEHYYITDIGLHCDNGQKFGITVKGPCTKSSPVPTKAKPLPPHHHHDHHRSHRKMHV